MENKIKIVRTDRELECPEVNAALCASGAELVLLAESVSEAELVEAVRAESRLPTSPSMRKEPSPKAPSR